MASVTRTVRFEKLEADLIDRFLDENPFLDFSTVARLAISQFIQKPTLPIKAIPHKRSGNQKRIKGSKPGYVHG